MGFSPSQSTRNRQIQRYSVTASTPTVGLRPAKMPSEPSSQAGRPASDPRSHSKNKSRRIIFCRTCRNAITLPEHRIAVSGKFRHTFFNPHGVLFEIGCFSAADGCRLYGSETSEFTWFANFGWRIALCARCATHMGWRFRSADSTFCGLILDRLQEGPGDNSV